MDHWENNEEIKKIRNQPLSKHAKFSGKLTFHTA